MDALKTRIRNVPDFPKPGILFYDVTTLLRDPEGFKLSIDAMAEPYKGQGIDLVVGVESRGFILGAAVADRIGAGFVPVRKVGKLPSTKIRVSYDLEYGTDALESYRLLSEVVSDMRRRREGPALIQAHVVRPYSHSLSDDEKNYKPEKERQEEAKRDPLVRFEKLLLEEGLADEAFLTRMRESVDTEINEQTDCAGRGLNATGYASVDMSAAGKTLRFAAP